MGEGWGAWGVGGGIGGAPGWEEGAGGGLGEEDVGKGWRAVGGRGVGGLGGVGGEVWEGPGGGA